MGIKKKQKKMKNYWFKPKSAYIFWAASSNTSGL